MTTDKGGSDLDVFNDLKPQTPDGHPILETKKTLMGLQAAASSGLPPVPGSPLSPLSGSPLSGNPLSGYPLSGNIAPPPPSPKSSPAGSSRSIPPPPPSRRSVVGMPAVTASGEPVALRARRSDEERTEDTSPSLPPIDAGSAGGSKEGLGLDSWVMTQPPMGRLSLPPAPPGVPLADTLANVAAPASAGANSDVGWDDDDDKTQVYDKDTQAAAQSLLQPVLPGLPGRPPPPMSRPPGAILPPGVLPPGAAFVPRATIPPTPHDATYALPQPAPSQKLPYLFAAIAAGLLAALVYVLLPKKGGLTVTVAGGPGNKELAAVEVIVDNKVRCRASPCELPSLQEGTHYVEVRAAGYQATAKSAVAIVGGQTAVHNVQLIRAGTGIKVFGEGSGLTLLVDGKELGPLPQELREMEPGEHVIQVTGGHRYEPYTQRIVVDPDRMTPIGPIKLKVLKGLATIRPGLNADGAEVTLKVGDSRRVLPALPVRLEVETDRPHVLIAKRKGYTTFEEPIVFEDGKAEKTIEIILAERPTFEDPNLRRRRVDTAGFVEEAGEAPAEGAAGSSEPAAAALLQLTSTPPSNVLLDGKPLGTTPLSDVAVEPGPHRVIFIYGAERKPKLVEVTPGSNQTVSVSF